MKLRELRDKLRQSAAPPVCQRRPLSTTTSGDILDCIHHIIISGEYTHTQIGYRVSLCVICFNSAPTAPPAGGPVCSMFGIVVMGGRSHLGSAPLHTEQQERTDDVNG